MTTHWKTFHITPQQTIRQLASYWQSSVHAFGRRNYVFDTSSIGKIETDLPLSVLHTLFRFAGVPWQDCVTDTKTGNL